MCCLVEVVVGRTVALVKAAIHPTEKPGMTARVVIHFDRQQEMAASVVGIAATDFVLLVLTPQFPLFCATASLGSQAILMVRQ